MVEQAAALVEIDPLKEIVGEVDGFDLAAQTRDILCQSYCAVPWLPCVANLDAILYQTFYGRDPIACAPVLALSSIDWHHLPIACRWAMLRSASDLEQYPFKPPLLKDGGCGALSLDAS